MVLWTLPINLAEVNSHSLTSHSLGVATIGINRLYGGRSDQRNSERVV